MLADLLIGAVGLAVTLRLLTGSAGSSNVLVFAGLVLVWHVVLIFSHLYDPRGFSKPWAEVKEVVKATTVASLVILAITYFSQAEPFSSQQFFFVVFWSISMVSALAYRLLAKIFPDRVLSLTGACRNLLVVGLNEHSRDFVSELQERKESPCRVIGYVDAADGPFEESFRGVSVPVISPDGLEAFLRVNLVDEVLVAVPADSFSPQIKHLIKTCAKREITVRLMLDTLFGESAEALDVELFFEQPTVKLDAGDSSSKSAA